jgi:hypothetical protein
MQLLFLFCFLNGAANACHYHASITCCWRQKRRRRRRRLRRPTDGHVILEFCWNAHRDTKAARAQSVERGSGRRTEELKKNNNRRASTLPPSGSILAPPGLCVVLLLLLIALLDTFFLSSVYLQLQ